ncbi:23S rRNA (pseudouridine1915-N3)-methyltransferase [Natranaerovirga hydrolytica]|uniref:Ribosomal RNA large subunit methyltransferase H n=1 Tax=Natranaerovirga hydrolytica TaxID=680378 RepID=A0A4R1MKB9_9FIRM|nr:23S rRNA (pseudouridine(1915)-N(3))-methyltransferase RlmH [Natranaerovirga hydrolytica]TCK93176.1 23S rRNA (pseudouridine1915-N3)-methyltransferase [Natranaerovirga hydrolytica]
MQITVLTVGKLKEKYLKQAIEEYSKRLSRYAKLQIIEVADEKAPDNMSLSEEEQVKKKEGEKLNKYIKDNSYIVALAIEGKQLTSEAFAKTIEDLGVSGKSNITFIIGGSLGLSEDILKKADRLLSFSKMTFPHQLMRVFLLEQLYRAYRINNNEPYHK